MVLVKNALRRAIARSLSATAPSSSTTTSASIQQAISRGALALQTRGFSQTSNVPDPKDILRPDVSAKTQLPLDQELPGYVCTNICVEKWTRSPACMDPKHTYC